MALSFKEYHQQRNEIFDFVKGIKDKVVGSAKAATGIEDERGKRDLAVHAGLDAAKKGVGAAQGVGDVVQRGVGMAANVATGNVVGAALGVWGLIKSMAGAGTGLRSFAKAGSLVNNVLKQKEALTAHLTQQVDPNNVKRIVDAIFEVDVNGVEDLPLSIWPVVMEDFMARLATGYDNLDKKILATVIHENLQKWLAKYGAQAEGLEQELSHLLQERREKIQVVSQPKVAQILHDFDPLEPSSPQAREPAGSARNAESDPADDASNLFGGPPTAEPKAKTGWFGGKPKVRAPKTQEELRMIPPKNGRYKSGEIVYKRGWKHNSDEGDVIVGVVMNHNDSGLFTFFDDNDQVWGDNPDGVRGVGQTVNDIKGTPFYDRIVKLVQKGHQHGLDSWAQKVGLQIPKPEEKPDDGFHSLFGGPPGH